MIIYLIYSLQDGSWFNSFESNNTRKDVGSQWKARTGRQPGPQIVRDTMEYLHMIAQDIRWHARRLRALAHLHGGMRVRRPF